MNKEPIIHSFDPDGADFTPYGLTCVQWAPTPMPRPDHHNEIELNLLTTGSVTYILGGKKVVVEEGQLGVFWGAIPHQIIDYTPETIYMVATIPLQFFLDWGLSEGFVQSLMQGELLVDEIDRYKDSDEVLFGRWLRDLQDDTSSKLQKPVLLEMQARLIRFSLNSASVSQGAYLESVNRVGLSKVELMACFIAQNYTQKLTAEKIGKHVKLHPNYAMTLFQKVFGMTLVNYLTQHRIAHAQRLLTTTSDTITEIAYRSGFQSISRFNDAFCKESHCSPREYRRQHELPDNLIFKRA